MKKLIFLSIISTAFLFPVNHVSAQTKVPVKFAKGASSAALKGSIAGYRYIDYIVGAKSGQTMTVKLKTANQSCRFYIYYSDMKDVAEASDVTESTRSVDVDDNYIVRVIMPRSAARRKETAGFILSVSIE